MTPTPSLHSTEWIDISVPLANGMVLWPGNPPVSITRRMDRKHGDPCNLSALTLGAHDGTHLDAPIHFIDRGAPVDRLDPARGIGPARVVEITDPVAITAGAIADIGPARAERILFKSANSDLAWQKGSFDKTAVHLTGEASQALADAGVALVGIDYLSVAGFACHNGEAAHRPLLEAGVWVLEGLDLGAVGAGEYELCCVPLRLVGSDASPVRALLRPLGAGGDRQ